LSFLGYSDDEQRHTQEQAIQQGRDVCEVGDSACIHLIVD